MAAVGSADPDATVTAGPGEVTGPTWHGPVPPAPTTPSIPVTPSISVSVPDGPPSQTPGAAALSGVHPEVAALPMEARVQELARVEDGMETWILSRVPELGIAAAGADQVYGDRDGAYGVDVVNPVEYGEVLLLGSGVPIIRAYPLPGLVPSWIHVTVDAVYAGRLGDGGLPRSGLVRIDRATLDVEVIVFPAPDEVTAEVLPLPGWRAATAAEAERYGSLVTHGPDAVGTRVATAWGPDGVIGVDIAGVEELFAAS